MKFEAKIEKLGNSEISFNILIFSQITTLGMGFLRAMNLYYNKINYQSILNIPENYSNYL